jgi:hypothetical protein
VGSTLLISHGTPKRIERQRQNQATKTWPEKKTDSAAFGQLRKYVTGTRGVFHRELTKNPAA